MSGKSSPSVRRRKRRQGPTHLGFERLLALFGLGEADRHERYAGLRGQLVRFFRRTRCPFPQDLADEVIDRVARRLEEGVQLRAETLQLYCSGVARVVYRESLRDRHTQADRALRLARALAERAKPPNEWRERLLDCLDDCLSRLPAGDRRLLLAYYQGDGLARERQNLCRELSVSASSLRLRTYRLRRRVEIALKQRLEEETKRGEGGHYAPGGTSGSSSSQAVSPPW